MKKITGLLCSLIVLVYFLIVWGGVVRSSGSGLGCPDWPLCHGQIIPPFEKEILIEYAHRLLASLVGILTLVLGIVVWFRSALRNLLGKWTGFAFVLLILQIVLGGVTVKSELHPYIVATHLGVALIFFAVIFYMLLRVWKGGDKSLVPKTKEYRLSHWALTLLFCQMVLGSLVAASHAGLACPDFPTCQGEWFPALSGLVGLHFLHRVGALLMGIMVVVLFAGACRHRAVKWVLFFAVVQILLGIGNVLLGLPFWMRISHLGIAVLLYAALILSTYELRRYTS